MTHPPLLLDSEAKVEEYLAAFGTAYGTEMASIEPWSTLTLAEHVRVEAKARAMAELVAVEVEDKMDLVIDDQSVSN